jgi:hypothetical protein
MFAYPTQYKLNSIINCICKILIAVSYQRNVEIVLCRACDKQPVPICQGLAVLYASGTGYVRNFMRRD